MKKLIPISLFAIAAFCGCGDDYIVDSIYPEYKIGAYYYESSSLKKTDTLYLMYLTTSSGIVNPTGLTT